MILSADIGGTKVNIALYHSNNKKIELYHESTYPSQNYSSFYDILEDFCSQHENIIIDKGSFGIAGPIIDDRCITTNLPWTIEKNTLQTLLQTEKVFLLNDLEATAYGMIFLDPKQLLSLQNSHTLQKGNIAVLAAGTGLGEGMLYFDGEKYHPIGCEGGHTDFAPQNPLEDALLVWLRKRFPNHVSYERILCGDGIFLLYEFLSYYYQKPLHNTFATVLNNEDKNSMVTTLAQEKNDPLAQQALQVFCSIYGAEAGNLALKSMALGGVYIGGGIAPKILPFMEKYFMRSFYAKGRFQQLLQSIDVKISLEPKTALLGAAYYALLRD